MNTDDVVIVAAARTAQGRLKGQLASFTAPQLGGFAIAGALAQGGIPAGAVDAVIMGILDSLEVDGTVTFRKS